MSRTAPSVRTLADQVWGLAGGVAGESVTTGGLVNLYRGTVVDPPTDDDGAVHAYAVFYFGAGRPRSTRMGGGTSNLSWTFQITCVGGDDVRALWCIDEIRSRLTGVRLSMPDGRSGTTREVGDTGPLQQDRDATPYRYFLPLDFGAYV